MDEKARLEKAWLFLNSDMREILESFAGLFFPDKEKWGRDELVFFYISLAFIITTAFFIEYWLT